MTGGGRYDDDEHRRRCRRRSIDGAVAIAFTPPACAQGASAVGRISVPVQTIVMTLPSGPAKADEASREEEAAATVPDGMMVDWFDDAEEDDEDEWSGAASRSAKRGQLAAPAMVKEKREGDPLVREAERESGLAGRVLVGALEERRRRSERERNSFFFVVESECERKKTREGEKKSSQFQKKRAVTGRGPCPLTRTKQKNDFCLAFQPGKKKRQPKKTENSENTFFGSFLFLSSR